MGGADAPDEYPPTNTGTPPPFTPSTRPAISRGSRNHILGNHRPGANIPGKDEFPSGWTDDEIMDAVDAVLARPAKVNQFGDQFVFRGEHRGIVVSASVRTDKPRPFVWTSYPPRSQRL